MGLALPRKPFFAQQPRSFLSAFEPPRLQKGFNSELLGSQRPAGGITTGVARSALLSGQQSREKRPGLPGGDWGIERKIPFPGKKERQADRRTDEEGVVVACEHVLFGLGQLCSKWIAKLENEQPGFALANSRSWFPALIQEAGKRKKTKPDSLCIPLREPPSEQLGWERAKKMEHEMEATAEGETVTCGDLDSEAETAGAQVQPCSQDDLSLSPKQGARLRSRQKTRQHNLLRPWKSLPATPVGELENDSSVFFSSLTSLQAEEFFDMVAKVQARRYNDQRADFTEPEELGTKKSGVCEEQLYNTILAHQSQRLEDQRTEPPIPVGVQGLLDLLIRAQGTRMEDQRSALPPSLAAPSLLRRQPSFLHSV